MFYGCDELKEAIEQEIDIPISFTFSMDVAVAEDIENPSAPTSIVTTRQFYNILTDPAISDRVGTREQIKKARITNMQYEYKNFNDNVDTIISGEFEISGSDAAVVTYTTDPVNVTQADLLGDRFMMKGEGNDRVNDILANGSDIGARFVGESSHNPAIFAIELTINATITVDLNANDL